MNKYFLILGLPLALSLSACAKPRALTIEPEVLGEVNDIYEDAAALTATAAADMPTTGSATYTGALSSVDNADSGMVGDLTLVTDFATSAVTGGLSNVNIIIDASDSGAVEDEIGYTVQSQNLSGTLDISNGMISGTGVTADLGGDLKGAIDGVPLAVTFGADLALVGNFLSSTPGTPATEADIIRGTVTGTLEVSAPLVGTVATETYSGDSLGFTVCTSDCATLIP